MTFVPQFYFIHIISYFDDMRDPIILMMLLHAAMLKDMQKITYHAMVCSFAYFYPLWSTLSKCQKVGNSIKGFFWTKHATLWSIEIHTYVLGIFFGRSEC